MRGRSTSGNATENLMACILAECGAVNPSSPVYKQQALLALKIQVNAIAVGGWDALSEKSREDTQLVLDLFILASAAQSVDHFTILHGKRLGQMQGA